MRIAYTLSRFYIGIMLEALLEHNRSARIYKEVISSLFYPCQRWVRKFSHWNLFSRCTTFLNCGDAADDRVEIVVTYVSWKYPGLDYLHIKRALTLHLEKKLTLNTQLVLYLGNCNKFYFTFKFEVRMRDQIYQIFKRDQIPIHQSQIWILINQKIFKLVWI